jgi:DNA-binding NarL/FixJ family response regulator
MRVLLADDQSKVRSALRLLLKQEPGMSVVGEAVEAEDLLAQVEATQLLSATQQINMEEST